MHFIRKFYLILNFEIINLIFNWIFRDYFYYLNNTISAVCLYEINILLLLNTDGLFIPINKQSKWYQEIIKMIMKNLIEKFDWIVNWPFKISDTKTEFFSKVYMSNLTFPIMVRGCQRYCNTRNTFYLIYDMWCNAP